MANQEGISQDQTVASTVDDSLQTHSLLETLDSEPEFAAFAKAVRKAGAEGILDGPDFYTLFAPVNFKPVSGSPDEIDAILQTHMMRGSFTEAELRSSGLFKRLDGGIVTVEPDDEDVTLVGRAKMVRPDVECTNGVIHGIEGLI